MFFCVSAEHFDFFFNSFSVWHHRRCGVSLWSNRGEGAMIPWSHEQFCLLFFYLYDSLGSCRSMQDGECEMCFLLLAMVDFLDACTM